MESWGRNRAKTVVHLPTNIVREDPVTDTRLDRVMVQNDNGNRGEILTCYLENIGIALIVALTMAVGCAEQLIDPDEEVTIEQGIYGLTTRSDDTGGDPDTRPNPGFAIEVFLDTQSTNPDDGETPYVQTTSNEDGFYQLELIEGDYFVCSAFRRCVTLQLGTDQLVRLNYNFGLDYGWNPIEGPVNLPPGTYGAE